MDTHNHFHSLDELIRGLDRERALLKEMFAKRKTYSFRYDIARELAAKKEESLDFLRRNGVIWKILLKLTPSWYTKLTPVFCN